MLQYMWSAAKSEKSLVVGTQECLNGNGYMCKSGL